MNTLDIADYIVTVFFAIGLTLMLVLFNWKGKAWTRLGDGDIGLLIQLNQRTSVTYTKTPIVHVWYPFQKVKIYTLFPDRIDLPAVSLATGGEHPSTITINNPGFKMRVVDPEFAYWETPGHDPEAQLRAVVVASMTEFTAQTDLNTFTAQGGVILMKERVTVALQQQAAKYGAEVSEFWANDIDLPSSLVEATDIRVQADAEVYRKRVLTDIEIDAFLRQKAAQKEWYFPLEVIDRWTEGLVNAAKAGLKVFGGDMQSMMQALVALGFDKEKDNEKP